MIAAHWPFMRQMYTEGESCMVDGKAVDRQVELRAACSPDSSLHLLVREPNFCRYIMVLYHPELCEVDRLMPVPVLGSSSSSKTSSTTTSKKGSATAAAAAAKAAAASKTDAAAAAAKGKDKGGAAADAGSAPIATEGKDVKQAEPSKQDSASSSTEAVDVGGSTDTVEDGSETDDDGDSDEGKLSTS